MSIEARTPDEDSLSGHVLVAEDNLVNQQVTLTMLEILGCSVSMADDGVKSLQILESCRPDIILMDCQMPEMDGFEATRNIRDRESDTSPGRRIPIITLTANAMKGDRERCMEAGMDDYLSKPFGQKNLRAMLEKWMVPGRASKSPEPGEALDEEALVRLRSLQRPDQSDVLEHFLSIYFELAPQLLDDLRSGVEKQDPVQIENTAHSFRSSSATLGATQIAQMCAVLESLGQSGELAAADRLVGELEAAYPVACTVHCGPHAVKQPHKVDEKINQTGMIRKAAPSCALAGSR